MKNEFIVFSLYALVFAPSIKPQTLGMNERLPSYSISEPETIPFIIVGTVIEPAAPAGNFHPARYDNKLHTRRYRVRLRTENVLQGDLVSGRTVDVFFFIEDRSFGTSTRLFSFLKGSRQLVFLQPDYGELRTIADQTPEGCVLKVLSGPHPGFKRDPSKPLIQDIFKILLSRGEGVSDKQMVDSIYNALDYRQFGDKPLIHALREITSSETPSVREIACSTMKDIGYSCKEKP